MSTVHGPEALHSDQLSRHLVVGQIGELVQPQLAVLHVLGKVAEEGDLGARQAARHAQLLGVRVEQLLRRGGAAAEQADQRARRSLRAALVESCWPDDRAHQRAVRVARAPPARARAPRRGDRKRSISAAICGRPARRWLERARLLGNRRGPGAGARPRPSGGRPVVEAVLLLARARVDGGSPKSHSRAIRCQFAVAPSWPSTPSVSASMRRASIALGGHRLALHELPVAPSAGRRSRSAPGTRTARSIVQLAVLHVPARHGAEVGEHGARGRRLSSPTSKKPIGAELRVEPGGVALDARRGSPRPPPRCASPATRLVMPKSRNATRPSGISR